MQKPYVLIERGFLIEIEKYLKEHPHMEANDKYIKYLDMLEKLENDLNRR